MTNDREQVCLHPPNPAPTKPPFRISCTHHWYGINGRRDWYTAVGDTQNASSTIGSIYHLLVEQQRKKDFAQRRADSTVVVRGVYGLQTTELLNNKST